MTYFEMTYIEVAYASFIIGAFAGMGWAIGTATVRLIIWRYLWVVTVLCNFPLALKGIKQPVIPDVRNLYRSERVKPSHTNSD